MEILKALRIESYVFGIMSGIGLALIAFFISDFVCWLISRILKETPPPGDWSALGIVGLCVFLISFAGFINVYSKPQSQGLLLEKYGVHDTFGISPSERREIMQQGKETP